MDQAVLQHLHEAIPKVRYELGLGTHGSVPDAGGEPLILVRETEKVDYVRLRNLVHRCFFLYDIKTK